MSRFDYFMKECQPENILEHLKGNRFDEYIYTMGGDTYRVRVYGNDIDGFEITEK